ncbi:YXWGXW repeat-containing protein [Dyella tabacisoli]|uniref:BcpO-related WXXGXW repeat protein n=1 Tax=Dyella tabacisoli TaxID=2282381 RepID=A0A369UMK9_9GAMM|nr:YXWGXW repeat-containing protein [Dyella tabacisoli]RDD81727.1 hypothetical protein DVJ77_11255 [Dyella tabacisoli]
MNLRSTRPWALFAGLGIALAAIAYTPPSAAGTYVAVNIGVPPPARIREVVPPPRRGYVWAPGYWIWNAPAHRHVWVRGDWIRVRPGYVYRPPQWIRYGNNWRFRDGYWGR